MRKEIIFAIIAGVVFGLIVALGMWRANSAIIDDITTENSEIETHTSQDLNTEIELVVSEPEQNDVFTENTANVIGIAKPYSWIAISAEDEEYTLRSTDSGEFNQDVALEPGINRLIVTTFDSEGSSTESIITVVYSSQFADQQDEE